jgi:ankyrin repeat protein
MFAAKYGHKPIAEHLIASGANVDEENYSGETALMYAAMYGQKDIVELLLKNHANPNAKNDAGATALGAAKSSTKPDKDAIVDLLQKNGAKE